MKTDTKQKTYTIDAEGRPLGHIASEAARVLMGKHDAGYAPNNAGDTYVTIENSARTKITEKKLDTKQYKRYSGWPGGLRHESLRSLRTRKGMREVLRRAVHGMLPANKLRKERMKRLEVEE